MTPAKVFVTAEGGPELLVQIRAADEWSVMRLYAPAEAVQGFGKALEAIALERCRVLAHEQHSTAWDGAYTMGELAEAASAYSLAAALLAQGKPPHVAEGLSVDRWPRSWSPRAFKVTTEARCLEKAGQLILAALQARAPKPQAPTPEATSLENDL